MRAVGETGLDYFRTGPEGKDAQERSFRAHIETTSQEIWADTDGAADVIVSGVGTGDSEETVKRTYPGRIRVEGHPYLPTGHYLVYVPADPALAHLSMIFETDGRAVTRFRAGMKGAVAQIGRAPV